MLVIITRDMKHHYTMEVLRSAFINVDYSSDRQRFSLSTNSEWMSLSVTSFKILLTMIDNSNEYQSIRIQQAASDILIIKMFKNITLIFTSLSSKRSYSKIQLCSPTLKSLKTAGENAIKKINSPDYQVVEDNFNTPLLIEQDKGATGWTTVNQLME